MISSALPFNNFGSRVVTTTKCWTTAKSCCTGSNTYDLGGLWASSTLFHRRIFGSMASCPPGLVDLTDKILMKCRGVPLAVGLISGLLANKPRSGPIWEGVHKFIPAVENQYSTEHVESILSLSYYGLPHYLKTCLLYLSTFPEQYPISRHRAVRSWIAEGFIVSGNYWKTLEEVGESYFNELINRSMIQPALGSYDGKTEAVVIPRMILDLIRSKSVYDNFVTLLVDGKAEVSVLHNRIRRLSIIRADRDEVIPKSANTSRIRTLCIFGGIIPKLRFKHFTLLRVLDLEGCKELKNHDVKEIAGLIHLRYLSIKDTPISELPDQVSQLQHLEMLDLRGTGVQELPMSIVQLKSLQHLLCDRMRFPEWIGKMTALSSLSQFDIFQSELRAVEQLGNLSELTELMLWWRPDAQFSNTERCEYLAVSLYRLKNLQSLYVHGSDCSVDFFDHLRHPLRKLQRIELNNCYLNRITEWFGLLPSLEYMCMDVKDIKNEDLQLLSGLPSLRHLSLTSKFLAQEKLVIGSKGFRVLETFHLHSARADLTFEPQAMQKLENLLLSLHVVPEETFGFSVNIDQLTCLRKIDVTIHGEEAAVLRWLEAAKVAIWDAAEYHENDPTANITASGNLVDFTARGGKPRII